ncbi:hypothetical protein VFPFJ_10338 [Purpureocillium lilacinum]|uniref:Uncharacterized protein n=1 Tax=Purpureocillium lilacinum TaxID=33203 RepID=A0A179GKT8_PURLI|nr:hypothetical protein VFPFJ_10338 [Purpureocillium lilacinum]OAQ77971.1 hypothetical protein VFPFJ_10338 [Purpureocillium lilacinum]
MQLPAVFRFVATVLAVGASAELHERDVYVRHIAPGQLKRLDHYRAENARSLTAEQVDVLERVKRIVSDHATHDVVAAREACNAAFGHQECRNVLSGRSESANKGLLGRRAPDCECADQDPYCDDPHICKYKLSNCNFQKGCGLGGLYVCNGLCE